MSKNRKLILFISLMVLPPFIILLSRNLFEANYFFSSLYKIIFFFPIIYGVYIQKKSLKKSLFENFSLKTFKRLFIKSLIFGLILSAIYFSAFYIFKDYLALSEIKEKLTGLISINPQKLIFIGLYIIIFNSLLEEFFWRSFLFKELNEISNPVFVYLITGFAFSFHHVMFYFDWFTLPFFITVTFGLVVYSMIMNKVFAYSKDLFTCWLVHALVDIVQIFIAFKLFNII